MPEKRRIKLSVKARFEARDLQAYDDAESDLVEAGINTAHSSLAEDLETINFWGWITDKTLDREKAQENAIRIFNAHGYDAKVGIHLKDAPTNLKEMEKLRKTPGKKQGE